MTSFSPTAASKCARVPHPKKSTPSLPLQLGNGSATPSTRQSNQTQDGSQAPQRPRTAGSNPTVLRTILQFWHEKALAYAKKQDYAHAIYYSELCLKLSPACHTARNHLALCYQQSGRYPDAENAYLHVLAKTKQKNIEARLKLANLYQQLGRYEDAENVYLKGQNNVTIRLALADFYRAAGRFSEAITHYTLCLRHLPHRTPQYLTVLNHRALCCYKKGMLQTAEQDYLSILSMQPNHFVALSDLGRLQQKGKRFDRAITYYTRALAQKQSGSVYENRAECYAALKQFPKARTDCIQALNYYRKKNRHDDYDRALEQLEAIDNTMYTISWENKEFTFIFAPQQKTTKPVVAKHQSQQPAQCLPKVLLYPSAHGYGYRTEHHHPDHKQNRTVQQQQHYATQRQQHRPFHYGC